MRIGDTMLDVTLNEENGTIELDDGLSYMVVSKTEAVKIASQITKLVTESNLKELQKDPNYYKGRCL